METTANGLILDRRAPDLAIEVDRLIDSPVIPEEAAAAIALWHGTEDGWRYLFAAEQGESYEIRFIDDEAELQLAMLQTMAESQQSRWAIHAEKQAQDALLAFLLEHGEPVGGRQ